MASRNHSSQTTYDFVMNFREKTSSPAHTPYRINKGLNGIAISPRINHEETKSKKFFSVLLRALRFFVVDSHSLQGAAHCDINDPFVFTSLHSPTAARRVRSTPASLQPTDSRP